MVIFCSVAVDSFVALLGFFSNLEVLDRHKPIKPNQQTSLSESYHVSMTSKGFIVT